MIAKQVHAFLMEPVVFHEKLHTTFNGTVHPVSTHDAAVHQYLGIKYATVPARFRQSRLCASYPPVTDATQHGYVVFFAVLLLLSNMSSFASPICPQPGYKGYEEELFSLPKDIVPSQDLQQDELQCLNLNITCPATASPTSPIPVMFFIHGYAASCIGSRLTCRLRGLAVEATVAQAPAGCMMAELSSIGAS